MKIRGKFERFLIVFMTFFIFSGYLLGLAILLTSGLKTFSKLYTIPIRVVSLAITVYYIIAYKKKSFGIKKNDVILLIFFSIYSTKVLYTESFDAPLLHRWYEYIIYFIFFNYTIYLFFRNVDVKKYLNLIVQTLLLSGFMFGVVIITFYNDILFASSIGRFGAISDNKDDDIISPLALAYSGCLNMSLLLPTFYYRFKKDPLYLKMYYILNFLLSMFLFVLGSTRGAFIVIVISLVAFIYSQAGIKRMLSVLYLIPAVFLFYFILEYTGSSLIKRVNQTINEKDSSGRDTLWSEAISEFLNHPIIGGKIEVSGIYPHNLILEILMSTGVIGFIIILVFTLKAFINVPLNKSSIYLFIIFINGFFQYMFSGALYMAIMFFFSVGLMYGYRNGRSIKSALSLQN